MNRHRVCIVSNQLDIHMAALEENRKLSERYENWVEENTERVIAELADSGFAYLYEIDRQGSHERGYTIYEVLALGDYTELTEILCDLCNGEGDPKSQLEKRLEEVVRANLEKAVEYECD